MSCPRCSDNPSHLRCHCGPEQRFDILDPEVVDAIRRSYLAGTSQAKIAKQLGLSEGRVSKICSLKTYRYVTPQFLERYRASSSHAQGDHKDPQD